MSTKTAAALAENTHLKEFLAALLDSGKDAAANDFRTMIGYVGAMERQLSDAAGELQAIRQELDAMRQAQNHPVRTALQNAANIMEDKISDARARLDSIKEGIVEGCKKALAAFKEKGVAALNGAARFFNIKDGLQSFCESLNKSIQTAERSIVKVETVSKEYHEIGRSVKNIGRAVSDKDAIQDAKPIGRVAKAITARYRSQINRFAKTRKGVDAVLGALNRLEQSAEQQSVLKAIRDHQQKPPERDAKAPSADKSRRMEPDL